jgi:MFS family permease
MTGAAVQGEAAAVSHRTALLSLAVAPGLLAVAAALMLPPRKSPAQPLRASAVRLAVSDRRLVLLGLLLFASATAYGLLLGAFRDGIQEVLGREALKGILATYFGTRLVVAILGGFSSDVLGRKLVVALAFLGGGVALAIAAFTGGVWGFRASAITLGLVSSVVPVSVTAYAGDWFEAGKRSLALGAAFVWRDAGMVLSLLGGQALVETAGSFKVALVVFAVLFVLCGLGALALPSRCAEERAQ